MSQAANQLIGSMVRKVGGFTFQELNLAIDDIQRTSAVGPDLSYDFITRPAAQFALATSDTEFLRLVLREAMDIGIDQASLVHALQNHDELTYELVHFAAAHRDDLYTLGGQDYRGHELAEHIQQTMRDTLTGDAAPYNAIFTQNGIASTTASIITASLGITDLAAITDADTRRITNAHLLLCMYNAWQPGVFALSGWDLVGALPLERDAVKSLISSGDTRWIERGAYDILGVAPEVKKSASGMPRARTLYGPLPEQLKRDTSFASRLAAILKVRKRNGLASGSPGGRAGGGQQGVAGAGQRAGDRGGAGHRAELRGREDRGARAVRAAAVGRVFDLSTRRKVGVVDDLGGFTVELPAFGGLAMIIRD